ncbi:MAG: hypothetical protein JWN14_1513 [Chthonomonadales bacterium]|nr:hypothetical protein [Chthonomonadales bacterium]
MALNGLSAHDITVVDQVAWQVGKDWRRPAEPICSSCCLDAICPRLIA